MKQLLQSLATVILICSSLCAQTPTAPMRIACIGDSITAGKGTPPGYAYPAQLQRMLGGEAEVVNYGLSGSTLMNYGRKPYQKWGASFKNALAFNPGIVVIQLGTNDTIAEIWAHKEEFVPTYLEVIRQFQALKPAPRIFLSLPPWMANAEKEAALQEQLPMIKQVAQESHAEVIDVHGAFLNQNSLLADGLHPNKEGATVLARAVYAAIKGKPFTGEIPEPSPPTQPAATKDK